MQPYVYAKAKYHDESVQGFGLPAEHAGNHTVFFLRWLFERGLTSESFATDGAAPLAAFRGGDSI